jgi:hypothetical protein
MNSDVKVGRAASVWGGGSMSGPQLAWSSGTEP